MTLERLVWPGKVVRISLSTGTSPSLGLVLASVLALFACGKVADPLPPFIQIPLPVSDLTAIQFGKQMNLSWTLPKLNVEGSEATTLEWVEIYRLSQPPGASGVSKDQFGQEASLLSKIPKQGFETYRQGEKMVFKDTLSGLDNVQRFHLELQYAVKAVSRKKQDAGFSNTVSVALLPLPEPPSALHSSYGEGFIELRWDPPDRQIDGSPVMGEIRFNIYRSETAAMSRELLNQTPQAGTAFRDTSAAMDKAFNYVVRSVVVTSAGAVESFDSTQLQALNQDVYPPRPPAEPSGFSNGEFISLVWIPSMEPDLAGYRIYRRIEGQSQSLITRQLLTSAAFQDQAVEKGKLYRYRVTSVDTHGNESGFSEEVAVRVE